MMGRGFSYGYDMMGGAGWLGVLLMLLFWALIIAGIVVLILWILRSSRGHGTHSGASQPPGAVGHDEAAAIARRRFASGEITKDQYDEIMRSLGG